MGWSLSVQLGGIKKYTDEVAIQHRKQFLDALTFKIIKK